MAAKAQALPKFSWGGEVKQMFWPRAAGKPSSLDNEDLLLFEKSLTKPLVKRTLHLRHPEYSRIVQKEYMQKHNYSLLVRTLAEKSFASGERDERGYIVTVFYDPVQEQTVLPALSTIGVGLREAPREIAEQDSRDIYEQIILCSEEVQLIVLPGTFAIDEEVFNASYKAL
mmetsp:Transcript_118378/g.185899  ORF Transcript_118378/g.185899 Transcript_118378/m.185899 type:complete len:171 (-) Transcript_118378:74-586(-)